MGRNETMNSMNWYELPVKILKNKKIDKIISEKYKTIVLHE